MQAAADNADECIGFCWNGPRDANTAVTCFLKNMDCGDSVGGAGGDWHTYLLLPPPRFEYHSGFLPGHNDLTAGLMSVEDAMEASSCHDSIGFTWNGEKEPSGKLHIYVKSNECSTDVGGAGGDWHTMLRVSDLPAEGEIVTAAALPPPASHETSPDDGVWPAELLSQYRRAGDAHSYHIRTAITRFCSPR